MPGSNTTRGRPSPLALTGLCAAALATCAATWTGTYEGEHGTDRYRVVLSQIGATVRATTLRISLADQAPCALAADACDATLALDGHSVSADQCTLRLGGHPSGCGGEISFAWRGTEAAASGSVVSELLFETTLDDVPITLRRVQPPPVPGCGLGGELILLLPALAWLRRRSLARARCDRTLEQQERCAWPTRVSY
jgi:hypothetical protein